MLLVTDIWFWLIEIWLYTVLVFLFYAIWILSRLGVVMFFWTSLPIPRLGRLNFFQAIMWVNGYFISSMQDQNMFHLVVPSTFRLKPFRTGKILQRQCSVLWHENHYMESNPISKVRNNRGNWWHVQYIAKEKCKSKHTFNRLEFVAMCSLY